MKLTYRIDTLAAADRAAYVQCGKVRGNVVVIDSSTPCAAALFTPARPDPAPPPTLRAEAAPKPRRCSRCHGPHDVAACPIEEGFDPEQEKRRLRHGCCGPPARDDHGDG